MTSRDSEAVATRSNRSRTHLFQWLQTMFGFAQFLVGKVLFSPTFRSPWNFCPCHNPQVISGRSLMSLLGLWSSLLPPEINDKSQFISKENNEIRQMCSEPTASSFSGASSTFLSVSVTSAHLPFATD